VRPSKPASPTQKLYPAQPDRGSVTRSAAAILRRSAYPFAFNPNLQLFNLKPCPPLPGAPVSDPAGLFPTPGIDRLTH